jgi:outer membrane protein, heavy metal efflux system
MAAKRPFRLMRLPQLGLLPIAGCLVALQLTGCHAIRSAGPPEGVPSAQNLHPALELPGRPPNTASGTTGQPSTGSGSGNDPGMRPVVTLSARPARAKTGDIRPAGKPVTQARSASAGTQARSASAGTQARSASEGTSVVPLAGASGLCDGLHGRGNIQRTGGEEAADPSRQPSSVAEPGVFPPGQTQADSAVGEQTLTLTGALTRSLLTNPDLVALRGQFPVSQAAVGVAETYPWNPFVQAQLLPRGHPFVPGNGTPDTAAGQTNYYVWAMQRFELAHQRRFRTQGALATLNQTQWNIFQAELLNVAQTTRVYLGALYQKGLRDLARETADLNQRLLGIVERRYKASLARASDVTTARVAARQAGRQAELAEATYQAALLALRQQLNLSLKAPLTLAESLTEIVWLPLRPEESSADESLFAAELVEGRPDVMAARGGVSVGEANWRLARAAMIPDIQAGPIYERVDTGTRFLGLRLQMEIPINNNGAPLARQRRAEMNRLALTYEQLKVRAGLEAQSAINQYERVREMVRKVAVSQPGTLSPELKEITGQFQAGQADILGVIATQNNLLQERRIYLDLLNQLAQSAAAVIQGTGLPPDRIIRLPCSQLAPRVDASPDGPPVSNVP